MRASWPWFRILHDNFELVVSVIVARAATTAFSFLLIPESASLLTRKFANLLSYVDAINE